MEKPSLPLTPNAQGEIIDHQCPECGAWATEHECYMQMTQAAGVRTLAEMRALAGARDHPTTDFLRCRR